MYGSLLEDFPGNDLKTCQLKNFCHLHRNIQHLQTNEIKVTQTR